MKNDPDASISSFLQATHPECHHYEQLFTSLLYTYSNYASRNWGLASYPGFHNANNIFQDAIEGFCRILPVMAAWLGTGRSRTVSFGSTTFDLYEIIHTGILTSVNPESDSYYGSIRDYDNRIIAAALFALSLWFTRNSIWDTFTSSEKRLVSEWLASANNRHIVDNNWHLFIVMINAVLKALGEPFDECEYRSHYKRHKEFYRGDGFYTDGPGKIIDGYNFWEVHPFLIWLDQIDPDLDRIFIRETSSLFLKNMLYFFSPEGFPIFGRSICYRLALPTPLVLGTIYGWSPVGKEETRAAFDAIWKHFLGRGAVKNGMITQGYYKRNPAILDDYSGSASQNWSLMSLAAAFSAQADDAFWHTTAGLLPVENADYTVSLPHAGFIIEGVRKNLSIRLHIVSNKKNEGTIIRLKSYCWWKALFEWLLVKSGLRYTKIFKLLPHRIIKMGYRPDNTEAKYSRSVYSSDKPFCEKT